MIGGNEVERAIQESCPKSRLIVLALDEGIDLHHGADGGKVFCG